MLLPSVNNNNNNNNSNNHSTKITKMTEYVDSALTEIRNHVTDETCFPTLCEAGFPKNYFRTVRRIFELMFHVVSVNVRAITLFYQYIHSAYKIYMPIAARCMT